MIYRMRMQSSHRRQLQELLSDRSREQACFLLCRQAIADDETLLLVVKVLALDATDLTVHRPDQLSVSPTAMLRIARLAQKEDAAVCMVHTHPGSLDDVAFSRADDIGNLRTFQFFHRMVPGQLHSCLVWSGNLEHTAGRIYQCDATWSVLGSVDIVSGENWNRYIDHTHRGAAFDSALFDRQARLLGEAGQAIISNLKIGIVGCGGLGSVAATLLVHSGIRNFTLVDFDRAEPSNLPRLLGATYNDAHHHVRKTEILQRVIKAVCPGAVVRTSEAPVEEPLLLKELFGLDAIICGTDDTTSRAFLNQLCHQYYVPLLDLGVQFVVDPETGEVVSNAGKINLTRPGDPCLLCIGHVNPQVLADEALDDETREHRRNEGYLRGGDVHEPAMMTFNMQVAARGVQVLVSWFSGFQPIPIEQFERYDFLGTANRGLSSFTRKRKSHGCPLCGPDSHLLGRGDAHPMVVAPRPRASISEKQS
mgnify:CR=1 FL=1